MYIANKQFIADSRIYVVSDSIAENQRNEYSSSWSLRVSVGFQNAAKSNYTRVF